MALRHARVLAAALGLAVVPGLQAADPPRAWLERMSESLATRNYDGLFTHTAGNQSEVMRILHRVEDGRSVERLVSLDGSGREIVRTPEEVHAYLPDRRVVLVEPRKEDGSLLKAVPAPGPELELLYELEARPGHRILGNDVRIVDVRPRDQYRYGYRLWLAEDTAMPLRSAVLDAEGRVIEQIQFTRLEMPAHIPASAVEPSVDATGYQWIRTGRRGNVRVAAVAGWRVRQAPPGFRLVASRFQALPGVPVPVPHLIFSDGLASVSVFIEPGPASGPIPREHATLGSANAYTTTVQGHVVTAVGEVPQNTVRDIASSVVPESGAPALDAGR
jgi:sigma-E factor negative regulatory protein RseB